MSPSFLLYIIICCTIAHLGYWVLIFRRLKDNRPSNPVAKASSTVVCYKNEARNISSSLPCILAQSNEQIVYVNDFSNDDGPNLIQNIKDKRLKAISASLDMPGKKAALFTGLEAASNSIVLLTDADCKPMPKWSVVMSSSIGDADVLLGYAPMDMRPGPIATFARYETYLTGIQYLSYAQIGLPYMGVGRNMAVKCEKALPIVKSLMTQGLASGDDDLLVQALSKTGIISTTLDPRSFVYSEPASSLSQYIGQKSRHITTSTQYRFIHQLLLSVFAGTHLVTFALSLLVLIVYPMYWKSILLILGVKWAIQMVINWRLMRILKERDLWLIFPLLDIATFVYYIVLSPYLLLKNKANWN